MGDDGVDARGRMGHGFLDKGARGVPGAEEQRIDGEQDPAAPREGECSQHEANENGQLQRANQLHAVVIVFPNEPTKLFGQRRLSSRTRGVTRLQGRQQGGAGVSSYVENRIYAEREQGQADLTRVQPYKSQG